MSYGASPVSSAAVAVATAAAASVFDPSRPDPTTYSAADPLVLFIIQASLIVGLSRFLSFSLRFLKQPRVIWEIIAGIIIGPSAMGRVPGFTSHIFPTPSIALLNLVATIGLVLFLFLVGLEVDFSLFKRNVRASGTISLVGMVVPFALGAAVSKGIYDRFVDENKVKFGTFLLFIGTSMAITAFPVLARILTELDMLSNHVGVIALSAGVGNDVVGWVLLALAIALVNASSGLIVLYVILTSIAWILVLWFIIRPLLVIACRRSGSFVKGPTQGIVCLIIFLVLVSAFITDRIGIHAIFGGFIVGLVVPHEIREGIVEKIEDLVACLFLPLYFALSGLKTDLGLLANGSIWGWTVCVIFTAFFGKFISCGLAARYAGNMDWRESGAIGSLMACKGLVELIVLNIGLSAGILNPAVFAMFVTMALVTTFLTTPLTLAFYPLSYRIEKERLRRGETIAAAGTSGRSSGGAHQFKFSIVLERFDHLPAIIAFLHLIKTPLQVDATNRPRSTASYDEKRDSVSSDDSISGLTVSALRLVELTERTSSLVKASDSQKDLLAHDSLSHVFNAVATGLGLRTNSVVAITGADSFVGSVNTHAEKMSANMIVIPWNLTKIESTVAGFLPNPFESIFGKGVNTGTRQDSPQYGTFVRRIFAEASCDVAIVLDRGVMAESNSVPFSGHSRLFFAFHGGPDDRQTLQFLLRLLSNNSGLTAKVIRVLPTEASAEEDQKVEQGSSEAAVNHLTIGGGGNGNDTLYPSTGPISQTEDNLVLDSLFNNSNQSTTTQETLKRITYETVSTSTPFQTSLTQAQLYSTSSTSPLTILVGRSRKDSPSHTKELGLHLKATKMEELNLARSSEVRKCLGDLGSGYVSSGVGSSIIVLQAAGSGGRMD